MRKIWTAAVALSVVLAVTGLAWAAQSNSSASIDASAGAAGSVTLERSGDTLAVAEVKANAGWTFEIEQSGGPEVEIDFAKGDLRTQFNAALEDGEVRIEVRESTEAEAETVTASTSTPTQDDDEAEFEDSAEVDEEANVESETEVEAEEETHLSLPLLNGVQTVQLGGLGSATVSVNAGQLALVSTNLTAGCLVSVEEQSADRIELEASCPNGEGEASIQISGGQLRVASEVES